ncbi:prunin 1 Pru du 6.0101-like [Rosa sericea]
MRFLTHHSYFSLPYILYSPINTNSLLTASPQPTTSCLPLIITMAKHLALGFSLCFLVLFHGCLASRQQSQFSQQNECQLNQIQAREPDNRIECEAGRIESWDYNQDDFQCAGVAVQRITIESNGLHLPSYTNTPRLVYVVQGRGHVGMVLPGCPETFEESEQSDEEQQGQQQQWQGQRGRQQQGRRQGQFGKQGQQGQQESFEQLDRHQRVRRVKEGDVIAVPAGVTCWTHNHGNQPLVFVSLFDMSNERNQLDQNPRKFYLAGNPQDEFNQQGEQGRGQQGRTRSQQQGNNNNNIFAGFDTQLLADALNIDQQTAQRLQGQNDNRPQIVRVQGRFDFVEPPRSQREERQMQGQQMQGQQGQYEQNGMEELFCHMQMKQNIGKPKMADVYSPQAGRISTLNSFSMPILRLLRLSAERGFFYNNAIYSPHWNLNAHEVYYVIRGSARVQVVNDNGETILDDQVRQGQLFIVPQNHAVLQKAMSNGYEYIAFKTDDNAMMNTMAGRTSVLRALPDVVLANAYQMDREQARNLKYNRQETVALSSSRSSRSQRSWWALDA